MVFGLDHILSEQEAAPEEISAIREWLQREGTACYWRRITTSASATISHSVRLNTTITATPWCRASSGSVNTPAH